MTIRRRPAALQRTGTRGQAMVEFALVFPILMILLVAVFDIGRGVFAYNSITNAVREGARLAVVNQDTTKIVARAVAETAIAETAAPNVTVAFYRVNPNADPTLNAACASPVPVGCIAVVTFQTTYQPFTPMVQNILFPSGVTISARSFEAVEFTCPNSTLTSADCPRQP